jgi:hypothetical protein
MLVFAGTNELFPLLDEVFSPIIRQFKKIIIREFVDRKDTADCVRKPLETLADRDPDKYFKFSSGAVAEIHDLTGGRPYEIQLLCHAMFRRIQEGQAAKMVLGTAVLDDVRRELASTQNLSDRPVLVAIRSLSDKDMDALNALAGCCTYATFDDVWKLQHLLGEGDRWDREDLYDRYRRLISLNILTEEVGKIAFQGDDFDRIYVKYFTAQQGRRVVISNMPLDVMLVVIIRASLVGRKEEGQWCVIPEPSSEVYVALERIIEAENGKDSWIDLEPWSVELYLAFVDHRDQIKFRLEILHADHAWGAVTFLGIMKTGNTKVPSVY